MRQPPVRGALGGVAEARLAGPEVRERPAQDAPGLRACPRAVVADALVRVAAPHAPRRGIEGRRLAHRAVLAQAELDVPCGVPERDVAQHGVAGLPVRPQQERRGLHGIDVGLAGADVGGFLRLGPEGQRLRARVVRRGQPVRAGQGDVARGGVAAEQRAEGGAVIEEEAAEHGLRARARRQPRGPSRGPRPRSWVVAVARGEPEHAVPEAARPVAPGRGRPGPRRRIGEVRKAVGHARRGPCDAAVHPGQRLGPGPGHCARILPLLRCAPRRGRSRCPS